VLTQEDLADLRAFPDFTLATKKNRAGGPENDVSLKSTRNECRRFWVVADLRAVPASSNAG